MLSLDELSQMSQDGEAILDLYNKSPLPQVLEAMLGKKRRGYAR